MGRLRVITNISLAFSYKALTRLFLAQAALHAGSEPTLTSSDGANVELLGPQSCSWNPQHPVVLPVSVKPKPPFPLQLLFCGHGGFWGV